MKKLFGKTLSILGLAIGILQSVSAQNTAFTYQGKLVDDCCPATGLYDLRLRLWGSASGGPAVGGSPTLTLPSVPVTNGLFAASLDFGATAFDGSRRWLEIEVRTNNTGSYVTLSPRTELTPTPYAIRASSATTVPDNSITAQKIAAGQVVKSLNGLRDAVNLVAGANVTLAPSGNNLQISSSGGVFSLNGSSAYYNGGNVGIGTTTPGGLLSLAGGGLNGSSLEQFALYADTTYGLLFEAPRDPNNNLLDYTFSWRGGPPAMTISGATRNVGIGTAIPGYKLDVAGEVNASGAFIASSAYSGSYGTVMSVPHYSRKRLLSSTWRGDLGDYVDLEVPGNDGPGNLLRITSRGNVGIGVGSPSSALDVNGRITASQGFAAPWGPILAVPGGPNTRLLSMRWDGIDYVDLEVPGATANNARFIFGANGNLSVGSLTIRGGADLAEPFQMSEEKIPEGFVVVIDDENPGKLKQATRAYDTRVAGIISGANGVKAGIALHQEGVLEGGQNVALSGRVYVRADASHGAIKPGDLLTTSDTPGHAMKATDRDRAHGAIIGKAMTGLKEGKGHVLVLVNLQ